MITRRRRPDDRSTLIVTDESTGPGQTRHGPVPSAPTKPARRRRRVVPAVVYDAGRQNPDWIRAYQEPESTNQVDINLKWVQEISNGLRNGDDRDISTLEAVAAEMRAGADRNAEVRNVEEIVRASDTLDRLIKTALDLQASLDDASSGQDSRDFPERYRIFQNMVTEVNSAVASAEPARSMKTLMNEHAGARPARYVKGPTGGMRTYFESSSESDSDSSSDGGFQWPDDSESDDDVGGAAWAKINDRFARLRS